jgi:hypothetical protein
MLDQSQKAQNEISYDKILKARKKHLDPRNDKLPDTTYRCIGWRGIYLRPITDELNAEIEGLHAGNSCASSPNYQ